MIDILATLMTATRGKEWTELYEQQNDGGKVIMIAHELGCETTTGQEGSRKFISVPAWGKKFYLDARGTFNKVVEV